MRVAHANGGPQTRVHPAEAVSPVSAAHGNAPVLQPFVFGSDGRPTSLNREGIEAAFRVRDAIRRNHREFSSRYAGLDAVHHGLLISRLMWNTARAGGGWGGHVLLAGSFGAAKSGVARFMLNHESKADPQFKLQMHQWVTEQSIIGGQKMDAAHKGRVEIETEGSLAHSVVGLLDETEKGNPSAFAPLLSVMNEGEVQVGKTHKANLETLYATSNASLGEMWRMLKADGQESTAGALFNRFHIKALLHNWLRPHEQQHVDRANEENFELGPLARAFPETHGKHKPAHYEPMPWHEARLLSHYLLGFDPSFMPVYREFISDLRRAQNGVVHESMKKFEEHDESEPFPYVPAGDLSERLRQQIPMMIRASAATDFWLSPFADDSRLEASLARLPNWKLGPDSLWRAAFAMTTLGRDAMKPRITVENGGHASFDVDYGESPDPNESRDHREVRTLKNQTGERTRFNKALKDRLQSWQGPNGIMHELGPLAPPGAPPRASGGSHFEIQLQRARGEQ